MFLIKDIVYKMVKLIIVDKDVVNVKAFQLQKLFVWKLQ